MQNLRADDDRVGVEAVFLRVPAAVVLAAEHAEQRFGFNPAAPCQTVFAVGGEDEVLFAQCAAQSDLCGFLALERCPQAQLSLTLQGIALCVYSTDEHHVPVELPHVLACEVCCVGIVLSGADSLAFRRKHLNHRTI